MMIDGSKANKSGQKLEEEIKDTFVELIPNLNFVPRKMFKKNPPEDVKALVKVAHSQVFNRPTLIKSEYYEKSLTGKIGYVDYRFVANGSIPIDITMEAKNQDVAGSVEEKYDAIMLRILLNRYVSNRVWLILRGKECEKFYSLYKGVFENAIGYLESSGLKLDKNLYDILNHKEVKVLMVDELKSQLLYVFNSSNFVPFVM